MASETCEWHVQLEIGRHFENVRGIARVIEVLGTLEGIKSVFSVSLEGIKSANFDPIQPFLFTGQSDIGHFRSQTNSDEMG